MLPDLDKYWKAVNDDPTDFTAWTYLLQYVDQEVRHYNAECETRGYEFYVNLLKTIIIDNCRTILKPHVKLTMRFLPIIPTVMVIGENMLIMKNVKETKKSVKR